MEKNNITATEFAETWGMTKPLKRSDLDRFTLEEIEQINKILVSRAVEVFGEIGELEAKSDFIKEQQHNRFFNAKVGGVFEYSCEFRFVKDNFFVPGQWFQEYLDKLKELRGQKQNNLDTFEDRNKAKMINKLIGRK